MREETRKPARGAGEASGSEKPWWVLSCSPAPGEGHSLPPLNLTPAAWGKQEAGTVAGKRVAAGGFAAAPAGTARSPPGAGRAGASFAARLRGAGGSVKGRPAPLRLRLPPPRVCPLQRLGRVRRDSPLSPRFAHPWERGGDTLPTLGRCWTPGQGGGRSTASLSEVGRHPRAARRCSHGSGATQPPGCRGCAAPRPPAPAPRPRAWGRGQRCRRGEGGSEADAPETHCLK